MWLMQFNLVHNNEMLIFLCLWVHDGAVCLAVSALRHTCTGSCRSYGFSIWNPVGKRVVRPSYFSASLALLSFFFLFPLLSQGDRCPNIPVQGLMAGLWGLLAMGAFYCLGDGGSQQRHLDILGSHIPLSSIQLLIIINYCYQYF